jgi:hypothetical protein
VKFATGVRRVCADGVARLGLRPFQIRREDLPGSIEHELLCGQDSVANENADGMAGHADFLRGREHRQASSVFDRRLVAGDALGATVTADTLRTPGVTEGCLRAHAVQRCSDVFVGPTCTHLTNDIVDLDGISHCVLARLRLANPELGVLSAAPMDHDDHFTLVVVDINNDLLDQCADESLFCPHLRRR